MHCDVSCTDAEERNNGRAKKDQYLPDILSALVQRYEAPVSSNRWDSPLFLVLRDGLVDCEAIDNALVLRKPPPPNQSTQNPPLSASSFLYELDRQTQAVVGAVMEAQRLGAGGGGSETCVPGCQDRVRLARHYTLAELARTRRQFLVYAKQQPCTDVSRLAGMFVQYLNANLTE